MNVFRVVKILSLSAFGLLVVGCASTPTSDAAPAGDLVKETTAASPVAGKSSRLRFKNGPLCLCSDGLQEDDILKGLNAKSPSSSVQ